MKLTSPIAGKVPANGCLDCGNLMGAMVLMEAKNRRQVSADSNNWGPRFGSAWNVRFHAAGRVHVRLLGPNAAGCKQSGRR